MTHKFEVRIDGKYTTVKVDGYYWGYDPIDDRAWYASEEDLQNYHVEDLMEMVTVITNSSEYVNLMKNLKIHFPEHKITYYKS